MIILGPYSNLNDIDVHLQPLTDELNEPWEFWIEIFDVYSKQTFQIRIALLWIACNFIALGMLSG